MISDRVVSGSDSRVHHRLPLLSACVSRLNHAADEEDEEYLDGEDYEPDDESEFVGSANAPSTEYQPVRHVL